MLHAWWTILVIFFPASFEAVKPITGRWKRLTNWEMILERSCVFKYSFKQIKFFTFTSPSHKRTVQRKKKTRRQERISWPQIKNSWKARVNGASKKMVVSIESGPRPIVIELLISSFTSTCNLKPIYVSKFYWKFFVGGILQGYGKYNSTIVPLKNLVIRWDRGWELIVVHPYVP